jgi:hypothetical protein
LRNIYAIVRNDFFQQILLFFINFGEMYFINVSSTNFAKFLELIANFWYHKIGKNNPWSEAQVESIILFCF